MLEYLLLLTVAATIIVWVVSLFLALLQSFCPNLFENSLKWLSRYNPNISKVHYRCSSCGADFLSPSAACLSCGGSIKKYFGKHTLKEAKKQKI